MVYRIYVTKQQPYAVEAAGVLSDVRSALQLQTLRQVRLYNRYDVEGVTREEFDALTPIVFSEPQVDTVSAELPPLADNERLLAVEYLPGQFDQRADSCAQCISLVTQKERPLVRTAKLYVLTGALTDEEFERVASYLINPVESRRADTAPFETLRTAYEQPAPVARLDGFTALDGDGRESLLRSLGLAMDADDLAFCQQYFRDTERRDPTMTELRVIDTYWSDHCRHTTFLTRVTDMRIGDPQIRATFERYCAAKETLYPGKNRPTTLMDIATLGAKALRAEGYLTELDESEEINACSVKITVDVGGKPEDWLLLFKNETHNHPTEIEPFGGAATCLGGAIRDPLSGRSYVYQAMRVTGAGDPTVPTAETLPGKLPQKKLTRTAAAGYSSYGNQIGLATGHVAEVYHPGYVAKRMEIGAVLGAAPAAHVRRERPAPGDVVLLLGGKTGRDGCGGATGSSKSHTVESLESCGAEVQKGNAPEERKLQRLFRDGRVTRLIKRCNDFGAGGVSVAIGELADGLSIDLDSVPKKYDGLDGTELAISESQERMAVVVDPADVEAFIGFAAAENLQCTPVAVVTERPRLTMRWRGETIVDLTRAFLNSNGAPKYTAVSIPALRRVQPDPFVWQGLEASARAILSDLNLCSQKGLVERFDASVGAATLLAPFGGAYQLSPAQAMAAKLPVLGAETTTASLMGWGFDPYLSSQSPYHGAACAVVHSLAKVVAAGGRLERSWLTFQEYFPRTKGDPERWGLPAAALLGAFAAQTALKVAAIGGKDSMSGSFEQLDVPPTLVSFAVSVADSRHVVSTEFKAPGHLVAVLAPERDERGLPDFESVKSVFAQVQKLIADGKVRAAWAVGMGGVLEAVCKMGFGNRIGFRFIRREGLTEARYGGFVLELSEAVEDLALLGVTTAEYAVHCGGESFSMETAQAVWEERLEKVFPYHTAPTRPAPQTFAFRALERRGPKVGAVLPRVVIPAFPGTNSEYDTARAFERAGIQADILVIRNQSAADIAASVEAVADSIDQAQIIAIPGGFSGGDEPEGSGKFILSFFRSPRVREAVMRLLRERDGLMLGICNGFQALIKLGLVPFGEILDAGPDSPTLTFNDIGRHQALLVTTRVASNLSPWLQCCEVGDLHRIPVSHGEGRFVASETLLAQLAANGQIATQYVDEAGRPTMDVRFNPNASFAAVEGITSPDGRVFGKMGHSERATGELFRNVPGNKDQRLFDGAAKYFR